MPENVTKQNDKGANGEDENEPQRDSGVFRFRSQSIISWSPFSSSPSPFLPFLSFPEGLKQSRWTGVQGINLEMFEI